MSHLVNDAIFTPDLWAAALESYASVTHLTVQLFDTNERLVLGPIHQTPLFHIFDQNKYDPGIMVECARRCLAQTDTRPAVTVGQVHGLATVGTSLMLDGKIVGAAVGGYVFADFAQASDIQGLARHAGIAFAPLWKIVRQEAPVPQRRLLLHGELLQVLGDALLRENHRTRQYEQAAAIIESSDDAIISTSLDSIITSWNGGAERLFGYSATEAIGGPVAMLMPPELLDEERGMMTRIRGGESIEHYETVRRRNDGILLDISLSVSPVTAHGRIVGASKVARDITARKRAENALRRLNEKLESLVEERTGALVASQDRLRALATDLDLAEQRERKRLAAELHDHLQQLLVLGKLKLGQGRRVMQPAGADAMKQVDDVLSDALKYTRTLVAELSPPVLRDHGLSAGLNWLGEYMRKHDMTVTVIVPSEEWNLPENQAHLLFQSVRELLINSSKYAGTGEATVRLEREDSHLRIQVRDEGEGFDLAAAAVPVHTTDGLSSKFGLFSIRERMKALGGRFEIDSAPGKGTTATLVLPLAARAAGEVPSAEWVANTMNLESEHAARTTQHVAPCEKSRIRVLLVDDHVMMRQGLRSVLDGYPDVELLGEAGDGTEALALIERLHPSVVVMDINMPNMNGIDATVHIKARHPDIIVLGLSVNGGGENRDAMIKAGAVRLLTKEAAVDELYQAIHAAVYCNSTPT